MWPVHLRCFGPCCRRSTGRWCIWCSGRRRSVCWSSQRWRLHCIPPTRSSAGGHLRPCVQSPDENSVYSHNPPNHITFSPEPEVVHIAHPVWSGSSVFLTWFVCGHLEASRAVDGEEEDERFLLLEGLTERLLSGGWAPPDPLQLGHQDLPHAVTFHNKVPRRGWHQTTVPIDLLGVIIILIF